MTEPKPKYCFYIVTDEGKTVEWRNLTETAAKAMYRATQKSMPAGVDRYGWEEQT